ncbi:MAG: hypothetical protein KME19_24010 [Microcoleus vaginatus WJT46-NPBG5]|jgi:uncharacterized cupredoxin-like copper-binding protein|nr:hypothetical protein [Microcoleus vaginatus WJT46-NPBG5]
MQKNKSIAQLFLGVVLSLVIVPSLLPIPQAEARRPISLFDARCVSTGPGRWRRVTSNVSVGRAVYTSYLYMGAGSEFSGMTCRIKSDEPKPSEYDFQTLQLEFGMRDNDRGSPANTIRVYLDGEQDASQTVTVGPGEKASLSVDVTNVRNIAVETVCNSETKYCDRVYFFKALLEPVGASTYSNPVETTPMPPSKDGSADQVPPPPPNTGTERDAGKTPPPPNTGTQGDAGRTPLPRL